MGRARWWMAALAVASVACGGGDEGRVPVAATGSGGAGVGGAGGGGGGGGLDLSQQGASCPPDGCTPPLECRTYCGFAGCGGNGQSFSTCELACSTARGNEDCPAGQICVSIADGPGEVCEPQ